MAKKKRSCKKDPQKKIPLKIGKDPLLFSKTNLKCILLTKDDYINTKDPLLIFISFEVTLHA
jgi:hypothetical protein